MTGFVPATAGPASAEALPLSYEQRDYFGLERHGYGAIPACACITGPLDTGALTAAAQQVIDRHEPLRMRLRVAQADVSQTFDAPGARPAVWVAAPGEGPGQLEACLSTDLNRDREGAVRLQLLREGPDRTVALAMVDHMACDAWGARVFLRELWTTYRAIAGGQTPALPPLTYQYSDHIGMQQARAASPSRAAEQYWRGYAQRYAASASGLRRLGPPEPAAGRADLCAVLPASSVQRARELAHHLGVSVNSLPLACLVLAAWSMGNADSIGVSFIYAGREAARTRPLVGAFHRTLPLLAPDISATSVAGFVTAVSAAMMQAMRLSRAPYSARGFDAAVSAHRQASDVGILYNQIPTALGKPLSSEPLALGDQTTVEFPTPHFWPCRWHHYAEPRLRVVMGGGSSPTMRVIFNEASVAEEDARAILTRVGAFLGAIGDDTPQAPVPAFVDSALGVV